MSYLVIRIRGTVNVDGSIQDTMKMMRLTKPNHAAIVPKDPSTLGMLKKVKDYVAYGEIDAGTAEQLLKARGRLMGDKPLDDKTVATITNNKYKTVGEFARALADGKAKLKEMGEEFKPLFRLHPPRGGHDGQIKRHFTTGGVLGYQGREINHLAGRML